MLAVDNIAGGTSNAAQYSDDPGACNIASIPICVRKSCTTLLLVITARLVIFGAEDGITYLVGDLVTDGLPVGWELRCDDG